ncbi:MAG: TolC family protein [Lentisphaeria bacterium]|nr:TolC family protein [Lentisphaeria bacterium]
MMRSWQKRTVALIATGMTGVFAGGCLDYQAPAVPVRAESFSGVSEDERVRLPEDLSELTLEEAQRIALANNPDFLSQGFAIAAAKARYYQCYSGYAPTVNAGMSVSQSFRQMYSGHHVNKSRSQSENYTPSISGQWLIFDCLEREMNLLAAKYKLRQSRELEEDARRLLMQAVAYAYNDILLAKAQQQIAIADIEYYQKMLDDAERKQKAGTIKPSDVLDFRISLKNGQYALRAREYAVLTGKFVLAAYLGLTDGTLPDRIIFPELAFPEEEYLPDVTVYLDQALASRPDLRACRDALKASQYSYWATLGSFGPSISASYQLTLDNSHNVQHVANAADSHSTSTSGGFSYGISANWNIFNGFYDYFATQAAMAAVAQSDYQLASQWLTVVSDVRTAYANYQLNVDQAKASRDILQLTRRNRELVENEYNAGKAEITRLNEAQLNLIAAQNNLAMSVINISNARAQLAAAVYASAANVDEPVPAGR